MKITLEICLYILVMAGVTDLIRMSPFVLFRRKIRSRFLKSLLFYMPYAVLTAMTVPAIFHATGSIWSAAAGFLIGVILAYFEKSLLTVALCSAATVLIVDLGINYIPLLF